MPQFRSAPKQPSVHVLTIELEGIEPRIWRTIEVPGNFTLHDLHFAIQDAMGWTNSHLHSFAVGRTTYMPPDPDNEVPSKDSSRTTVAKVAAKTGKTFEYIYDFGDNWVHRVHVEEVRMVAEEGETARLVAGARACPPDDCGGVGGYEDLVVALRKPKSAKAKELRAWLRETQDVEFDPEEFDLGTQQARVEQMLARELQYGDEP